jgi:hypothetical protein
VRGFGEAWLGGTIHAGGKERDWMRGDTVVAQFASRDTAGTSRALLSRIEARRAAQSYHLDTNYRAPTRPSINYARGDAIVVTMKDGATRGVDRVDIRGKVDGIQLEATSDTTGAPADSTPPPTAAQGASR